MAGALVPLTKHFHDYKPSARVLIVLPGTPADASTVRAVANIPHVQAIRAQDLNVLTVLAFPFVIAVKDALTVAEKTFLK